MFPTRLGADALKPGAHVRVPTPVDAEFIVEIKITAGGNIRDGQPVTGNVLAAREVNIENLPTGFGPIAEFLQHCRIRIRREHAQVTVGRRIAGEFVVVPQQPAQDLAALASVVPAVLSESLEQIVEDDAGLRKVLPFVLKHRNFAHDIDLPISGRPGFAVKEIHETRRPVCPGQFQVEGWLVGISRLRETVQQIIGHRATSPRSAASDRRVRDGRNPRTVLRRQ